MHNEKITARESGHERARKIVRTFDFDPHSESSAYDLRCTHIIKSLEDAGILETELEHVRVTNPELEEIFGQSSESWTLFTILYLFDEGTAQHSIETYKIARKKIEDFNFDGIDLGTEIMKKVDLPTLYRACLLHDVGKIEVPYSLVVNSVSDIDCARLLFERKDILVPRLEKFLKLKAGTLMFPEGIQTPEDLLVYLLDTCHVRPQAIAPVQLLLQGVSDNQVDNIKAQLHHCGKTLDDSLIDIMHTHDHYSERILDQAGMKTEAVLAGSHHRSNNHDYKISSGAIQVSVDLSHIIHLADVQNAITSARAYKGWQTPLSALKILATHAERGYVDSYITYIWIADELGKLENFDEFDQQNIDYIYAFIKKQQQEHLGYPPVPELIRA